MTTFIYTRVPPLTAEPVLIPCHQILIFIGLGGVSACCKTRSCFDFMFGLTEVRDY